MDGGDEVSNLWVTFTSEKIAITFDGTTIYVACGTIERSVTTMAAERVHFVEDNSGYLPGPVPYNGGVKIEEGTFGVTLLTNMVKEKQAVNNDFYHEPFIFKESEKDMHDLVASLFTKRIRDYDMPDGIEAPTNLRAYNATTDLDDHLTVFMGTIDVYKLPKPAWCRFFHITLSGKARFCKETLHMVDRSDVVVSGAFISRLRSRRLFKDLIAKSTTSLEDLFTQTHNFIRVEDANNENHRRDPHRETKQHLTYKDFPRSKGTHMFPATSDGKAMLFLSPRMFAPANRKDQMNYYEFHEDHGHDTNNCIDLQKEIEACVRKGPIAYLAKGAKSNDNCQANQPDPLPYNVILRLSRLTKLCAIASTLHSLMKFRTEEGIAIKKQVITKDRSKAITMEVSNLVEARILKPVFFPGWVFNHVMVKKSYRTWHMCIEFTNLNKACPKDNYPLPEIDQKIKSLEGFKLKCFLDTYKGYHWIRMDKEDEEKMSFHTEQGTFCYEKMPLKLKNVGAT
uniref:Reverse transcriptase domain-containing protein n=1 Tax=Tanacetum cinerariifolium TaxID=118510 RepID=A0A6L2MFD6_TANCI|nr:hypothetical protein [Tanacetum cinerariifolium]